MVDAIGVFVHLDFTSQQQRYPSLGDHIHLWTLSEHFILPLPHFTASIAAMQYTVYSEEFDGDWDVMMEILLQMGVSTIILKAIV
jgi:hypothetical protein